MQSTDLQVATNSSPSGVRPIAEPTFEEQQRAKLTAMKAAIDAIGGAIQTAEQADVVDTKLAEVVLFRKNWFEHHEKMRKPAWDAYQAVLNARKGLDDECEKTERQCRQWLADWTMREQRRVREERLRIEEQQQREREADIEATVERAETSGATVEEVASIIQQEQSAPLPVVPLVTPKPLTNSGSTPVWIATVTNMKLLCEAIGNGTASIGFVQADESALNKFANATKGSMKIPGVEIKESVTVRMKGRR